MPDSGSRSRVLAVLSAASLLGLSACGVTAEDPGLDESTSLYALVQTVDGTSFAPPLGPEPAVTGPFDPTLLGGLQVVLESDDGAGDVRTLGTFDSHTTPRLALLADHDLYFVNVPAAAYFTNPALGYRFRALLGGREIGRSDMTSRIFEVMRYVPAVPVGVKLRIESRPVPVLDTLTPDTVLVGQSATVTLHGSGFVHDSVARLGGEDLATTWVSPTTLTVTVPAARLDQPGDRGISVFTPASGGGTSATARLGVEVACADEGCFCLEGSAPVTCYTGPAGTQDIGDCLSGARPCVGHRLGACEGQILPTAEACDGADNDCDGVADNGVCGPTYPAAYMNHQGVWVDPAAAQTWVTAGQPIASSVYAPASLRADDESDWSQTHNPDGTNTGLIDDMGEGKAVLVRPNHVLIVGEQQVTDPSVAAYETAERQAEQAYAAAQAQHQADELAYRHANNYVNLVATPDYGTSQIPASTVLSTSREVITQGMSTGTNQDWWQPAFYMSNTYEYCTMPGSTILDAARLGADVGTFSSLTVHRANPYTIWGGDHWPKLKFYGVVPLPAGVNSDVITVRFTSSRSFTVTSANRGLLGSSAINPGWSHPEYVNLGRAYAETYALDCSVPSNRGIPTFAVSEGTISDPAQDWVAGDTVEVLFERSFAIEANGDGARLRPTTNIVDWSSRGFSDPGGPLIDQYGSCTFQISDPGTYWGSLQLTTTYANPRSAPPYPPMPDFVPLPPVDFESGDGMATVFRVNPDNTITKTGWSAAGIGSLENNSMCRLQEGYAAITDTTLRDTPPYKDLAYATAHGWAPDAVGLGVIYVSPEGVPSPYSAFYYSRERLAETYASEIAAMNLPAEELPLTFVTYGGLAVAATGTPGSGEFIFTALLRGNSGHQLSHVLTLHLELNTETGMVDVLDEKLVDTGMAGTQAAFGDAVALMNAWLATIPGASPLDPNGDPAANQGRGQGTSITLPSGMQGDWTYSANWNVSDLQSAGLEDISENATTFNDGSTLFMMSTGGYGNEGSVNAGFYLSGYITNPDAYFGVAYATYAGSRSAGLRSGRSMGMLHVAATEHGLVTTMSTLPAGSGWSYNYASGYLDAYDSNWNQVQLTDDQRAVLLAGMPTEVFAAMDSLGSMQSGGLDWSTADEGFVTAGEGRVAAFGNLDQSSRTVVQAADFSDPAHPVFFPAAPLATADWQNLEGRGVPAVHLGGNVFMVTGSTTGTPPGWAHTGLGVATFSVGSDAIVSGGTAVYDVGGGTRDDENKICALDSNRVFVAIEASLSTPTGDSVRRSAQMVVTKQ